MHILVVGSGGREHALAWKAKQSPLVTRLTSAPGNAGTAELGACAAIDPTDAPAIIAYCRKEKVDFVIIGPDAALAAGVADALDAAGIASFGPTRAAARIESSKSFAKVLCAEAGIPTSASRVFTSTSPAKAYLRELSPPYVVKADGLALGKGVIVASSLAEAEAAVDDMIGGAFGAAGKEIVIEEFLEGQEVSFFALSDGKHVLPLIAAQDHKRAFDGDQGPNTGGMGCYSPVPVFGEEARAQALTRIMQPAIATLGKRGTPYRGVLFAGLMMTRSGPKVFEFNARFGDPESQVMMVLLKSDIVPALLATHSGTLSRERLEWHDGAAITVVMATRGYPGGYEKGSVIRGLDRASAHAGVTIFHAGTAARGSNIIANGGRVLNVTARGTTLREARDRAYRAISDIDWPEGFYRRDIGWRALTGAPPDKA
ncbi:MAG TPA: phosphoribosylamine--glycine ligase [Alphaproteobacteria bacterium]|nr:phosphoribosylamine--glycine ligase [Alphaproteobacteria bacterium]